MPATKISARLLYLLYTLKRLLVLLNSFRGVRKRFKAYRIIKYLYIALSFNPPAFFFFSPCNKTRSEQIPVNAVIWGST